MLSLVRLFNLLSTHYFIHVVSQLFYLWLQISLLLHNRLLKRKSGFLFPLYATQNRFSNFLGIHLASGRTGGLGLEDFIRVLANYAVKIVRTSTIDYTINHWFVFDFLVFDDPWKVYFSFPDFQVLPIRPFLFCLLEQYEIAGFFLELGCVRSKFEGVSVAHLAKRVVTVIAIYDDTYFVFLGRGRVTEFGLGCTMKIFCRTNEISSILFLPFFYIGLSINNYIVVLFCHTHCSKDYHRLNRMRVGFPIRNTTFDCINFLYLSKKRFKNVYQII